MRNLLILSATVLCFASLRAEPELKGSPTELAAYLAGLPKTVAVAGESELKLAADRAVVSLKVVTEYKSLQETLRVNQEVRGKINAALKERGIPPERIQASRFSSTPKTGVFGDRPKSYRVENTLKVTIQDEKEFQAIGQITDNMPEVRYLDIEFEHSDKESIKSKALAQALDNAAARKKIFEERLGVKLTPKSFSQSGVAEQSPRKRAYGDTPKYSTSAQGGTGSALIRSASEDVGGVAEEAGSLFGELVFSARVTVEYAVESK